MRRLPDADNGAADPDEASDVARMRAEYIAPREADVLAADALVVGLPPELGPSSPECAAFFELLAKLRAGGKLGGKVAAAVGTGPVVDAVNRALTSAGLSVIRPEAPAIAVESCIALGRRVVAEAESVKRRAGT
jgi:flavorubredoxin